MEKITSSTSLEVGTGYLPTSVRRGSDSNPTSGGSDAMSSDSRSDFNLEENDESSQISTVDSDEVAKVADILTRLQNIHEGMVLVSKTRPDRPYQVLSIGTLDAIGKRKLSKIWGGKQSLDSYIYGISMLSEVDDSTIWVFYKDLIYPRSENSFQKHPYHLSPLDKVLELFQEGNILMASKTADIVSQDLLQQPSIGSTWRDIQNGYMHTILDILSWKDVQVKYKGIVDNRESTPRAIKYDASIVIVYLNRYNNAYAEALSSFNTTHEFVSNSPMSTTADILTQFPIEPVVGATYQCKPLHMSPFLAPNEDVPEYISFTVTDIGTKAELEERHDDESMALPYTNQQLPVSSLPNDSHLILGTLHTYRDIRNQVWQTMVLTLEQLSYFFVPSSQKIADIIGQVTTPAMIAEALFNGQTDGEGWRLLWEREDDDVPSTRPLTQQALNNIAIQVQVGRYDGTYGIISWTILTNKDPMWTKADIISQARFTAKDLFIGNVPKTDHMVLRQVDAPENQSQYIATGANVRISSVYNGLANAHGIDIKPAMWLFNMTELKGRLWANKDVADASYVELAEDTLLEMVTEDWMKIEQRAAITKSVEEIAEEVQNSMMRGQDYSSDFAAQCLQCSRYLAGALEKAGYTNVNIVIGKFIIDNPDPQFYTDWDASDFASDNEMESEMYTPLHYWVEVEGKIVDISAQQFNPELNNEMMPPIVYGDYNDYPRYIKQSIQKVAETKGFHGWVDPNGDPYYDTVDLDDHGAMATDIIEKEYGIDTLAGMDIWRRIYFLLERGWLRVYYSKIQVGMNSLHGIQALKNYLHTFDPSVDLLVELTNSDGGNVYTFKGTPEMVLEEVEYSRLGSMEATADIISLPWNTNGYWYLDYFYRIIDVGILKDMQVKYPEGKVNPISGQIPNVPEENLVIVSKNDMASTIWFDDLDTFERDLERGRYTKNRKVADIIQHFPDEQPAIGKHYQYKAGDYGILELKDICTLREMRDRYSIDPFSYLPMDNPPDWSEVPAATEAPNAEREAEQEALLWEKYPHDMMVYVFHIIGHTMGDLWWVPLDTFVEDLKNKDVHEYYGEYRRQTRQASGLFYGWLNPEGQGFPINTEDTDNNTHSAVAWTIVYAYPYLTKMLPDSAYNSPFYLLLRLGWLRVYGNTIEVGDLSRAQSTLIEYVSGLPANKNVVIDAGGDHRVFRNPQEAMEAIEQGELGSRRRVADIVGMPLKASFDELPALMKPYQVWKATTKYSDHVYLHVIDPMVAMYNNDAHSKWFDIEAGGWNPMITGQPKQGTRPRVWQRDEPFTLVSDDWRMIKTADIITPYTTVPEIGAEYKTRTGIPLFQTMPSVAVFTVHRVDTKRNLQVKNPEMSLHVPRADRKTNGMHWADIPAPDDAMLVVGLYSSPSWGGLWTVMTLEQFGMLMRPIKRRKQADIIGQLTVGQGDIVNFERLKQVIRPYQVWAALGKRPYGAEMFLMVVDSTLIEDNIDSRTIVQGQDVDMGCRIADGRWVGDLTEARNALRTGDTLPCWIWESGAPFKLLRHNVRIDTVQASQVDAITTTSDIVSQFNPIHTSIADALRIGQTEGDFGDGTWKLGIGGTKPVDKWNDFKDIADQVAMGRGGGDKPVMWWIDMKYDDADRERTADILNTLHQYSYYDGQIFVSKTDSLQWLQITYVGKYGDIAYREIGRELDAKSDDIVVLYNVHNDKIGAHYTTIRFLEDMPAVTEHYNDRTQQAHTPKQADILTNVDPIGRIDKDTLPDWLDSHGFTDGLDVTPEIALYEYGMLRNPSTLDTVFYTGDEEGNGRFSIVEISAREVLRTLMEQKEGFFSFLGQSRADMLALGVSNDNLAGFIHDLDTYNGSFSQGLSYDLEVTGVVAYVQHLMKQADIIGMRSVGDKVYMKYYEEYHYEIVDVGTLKHLYDKYSQTRRIAASLEFNERNKGSETVTPEFLAVHGDEIGYLLSNIPSLQFPEAKTDFYLFVDMFLMNKEFPSLAPEKTADIVSQVHYNVGDTVRTLSKSVGDPTPSDRKSGVVIHIFAPDEINIQGYTGTEPIYNVAPNVNYVGNKRWREFYLARDLAPYRERRTADIVGIPQEGDQFVNPHHLGYDSLYVLAVGKAHELKSKYWDAKNGEMGNLLRNVDDDLFVVVWEKTHRSGLWWSTLDQFQTLYGFNFHKKADIVGTPQPQLPDLHVGQMVWHKLSFGKSKIVYIGTKMNAFIKYPDGNTVSGMAKVDDFAIVVALEGVDPYFADDRTHILPLEYFQQFWVTKDPIPEYMDNLNRAQQQIRDIEDLDALRGHGSKTADILSIVQDSLEHEVWWRKDDYRHWDAAPYIIRYAMKGDIEANYRDYEWSSAALNATEDVPVVITRQAHHSVYGMHRPYVYLVDEFTDRFTPAKSFVNVHQELMPKAWSPAIKQADIISERLIQFPILGQEFKGLNGSRVEPQWVGAFKDIPVEWKAFRKESLEYHPDDIVVIYFYYDQINTLHSGMRSLDGFMTWLRSEFQVDAPMKTADIIQPMKPFGTELPVWSKDGYTLRLTPSPDTPPFLMLHEPDGYVDYPLYLEHEQWTTYDHPETIPQYIKVAINNWMKANYQRIQNTKAMFRQDQ